MNLVVLLGNIGKEPEIRFTGDNNCVANFSLATKGYKDNTDWHSCVAFGKTAELIQSHVKKGDKLGVQGRLQTRNYDDKDGVKRYVTEVVVSNIEFAGKSEGKTPATAPARQTDQEAFDDDIPF